MNPLLVWRDRLPKADMEIDAGWCVGKSGQFRTGGSSATFVVIGSTTTHPLRSDHWHLPLLPKIRFTFGNFLTKRGGLDLRHPEHAVGFSNIKLLSVFVKFSVRPRGAFGPPLKFSKEEIRSLETSDRFTRSPSRIARAEKVPLLSAAARAGRGKGNARI